MLSAQSCKICGTSQFEVRQSPSASSNGPAQQDIQAAYSYVPEVQKKRVDPDDPFGDVELVEW